jgi:thioester reductase-like protein
MKHDVAVLFLTGFPGFLGSTLLPRLLADRPLARAVCLVQRRWAPLATEAVGRLALTQPHTRGRIELVEGDIVEPGLGLAAGSWQAQVTEVFHFAAAYELGVPRDIAMRVNVDGTRHVLETCAGYPALRRVHYVSTCFVSGRHPGVFRESDLDVGQAFNNFYEESKALAEREVRAAMTAGLPATVYRPSVVVGDSRTGETQKYDGPYCVLQLLLRQPRVALLPVPGKPLETSFNVVPSDFVGRALAWLSTRPGAVGLTYHLADPSPMSIDRLLHVMAAATGRRVWRVPVPYRLARHELEHVTWLRRLLRVSPQALDYFVHPTQYDTTNASRDLAPGRVAVPRFNAYVDRLVEFMQAHPEIGSAGLR